jgi:SAM-dependent methyltransferase
MKKRETTRGGPPLSTEAVGVQNMIEDTYDRRTYDERMGVKSKHYLTMVTAADTEWIITRIKDRIAGRVVVEIGAGIGVLAIEMAKYAHRVYAIEVDPAWTWLFARRLYREKPENLTWIFDRAENLIPFAKCDVAIVVTGSDEERLRYIAGTYAPEVIMPWQDWNGGKAVVNWCSRFRGVPGDELCSCPFPQMNCDWEKGMPPGVTCRVMVSSPVTP